MTGACPKKLGSWRSALLSQTPSVLRLELFRTIRLVRRDGLALQILANTLDSGFAANAALLDAPIWRQMVDGVNAMRVDPHLSRLDLAGDADSPLDIAAPD